MNTGSVQLAIQRIEKTIIENRKSSNKQQNKLEEEKSMSTMITNILLPHDVVMDILSRLPVKSVLRFRCVSKPWKFFFSDPSFINMHLKHSINNNNNYEHLMLEGPSICSIAANESSSLADEVVVIDDYPLKNYPSHTFPNLLLYKVGIFGSCNGLLLIRSIDKENIIWNPSTKEFKKLPKEPPITITKAKFVCRFIEYGLGYDEITKDYKVVKIILFKTDVVELSSVVYSEVMVYSLRSNCWRKSSEDPPYKLAYGSPGRFVNGALHWVAEQPNSEDEENESIYTIVSFNLGDEKHRVIEQPNYEDNEKSNMSLNVLGGCLCIIHDFRGIRSEIWVMKDYGVKESWTKLFTISQPTVIGSFYSVRPIKFTKNGEVVFQKDKSSLFVYDPKHGTAKTLQIRGLKDEFQTYSYVESLISLNSGTFVGKVHLTLEETRALESKLYNWEMDARRRVFGR